VYLLKLSYLYYPGLQCSFALGSNNWDLWKFRVWRITASSPVQWL